RDIAMHMITGDGVDVSRQDACPQYLAVLTLAQRRIDLTDVAPLPIDVVREIMRTGLDENIGSSVARSQSRFQCLTRRCVYDVESRPFLSSEQRRALHGVRLDEWRSCGIPRAQASTPFGVCVHHAFAKNPGGLNVLRMRADHTAMRGRPF